MQFLRMKPGHGEVLLTEGDPAVREDEERLVQEFRRQLDEGMWAAVPTHAPGSGRRQAVMIHDFEEIPAGADRVIFFPARLGRLTQAVLLLTLLALTLVTLALAMPSLYREATAARSRRARAGRRRERRILADPGRERRAEQRARELLRSCVNEEEWGMYRDLGFIRVTGRTPGYAYLVYPHKPVVAYVPETGRLLNEYCVEFPDLSAAIGGSRLPDSDDVLAKWMALTGDERRLIRTANMHLPGRQVDPGRVRRDLWRLAQWERERSSATS